MVGKSKCIPAKEICTLKEIFYFKKYFGPQKILVGQRVEDHCPKIIHYNTLNNLIFSLSREFSQTKMCAFIFRIVLVIFPLTYFYLFNNAFSSSHYIASNDSMINV
jgi:hypothetical protein